MKNGFKFVSLLSLMMLCSCSASLTDYTNSPKVKQANTSDKEKAEYALSFINLNVDEKRVVTDLLLPSTGLYNSTVSYASSDDTVLKIVEKTNDNGRVISYNGVVTRGAADKNVNLTVTLTITTNGVKTSASKVIAITVLMDNSTAVELPLAFEEDFSSYKTGLELSSYYNWSLNKAEGGCLTIVESVDGNINNMVSTKACKASSARLSSDLYYTKKINAGNNKKCVLEGYFLVDGNTNGLAFETFVGGNRASSFMVSSSGYSYTDGGKEVKVDSISPVIGVWTKFRITYSTANGYYAVQVYDYKTGTLKNVTPSYEKYGASGVKGTMDSFKMRVKQGTKVGSTYISNLRFDAASSGNINENFGTNPNRTDGLGIIRNYEETILSTYDQKDSIPAPEFEVHNRFDEDKIYTKDIDYTITSSKADSQDGKSTVYSYVFNLLSTRETKTVTQTIYFDTATNTASISNFKVSYLKAIKKEGETVPSKGYLTISGSVIRDDATLYYLVLAKDSVAPTASQIKAPSSITGLVLSGNVAITERNISIDTAELDIKKEYDLYAVTSNLNGDSEVYSALGISTLVNISTVEEFYDMTINIDTKGSTFRLIDDLDFAQYDWEVDPLNSAFKFEGVLDGQGHTIKNLSISSTIGKTGIFPLLGGTVKNITFENCVVEGKEDTAIIAGNMYGGTIENINFKSCQVNFNEASDGSAGYFAIAIGRNRDSDSEQKYKNINIIDCSIKAPKYIGLLTGSVESGATSTIDNISAYGSVNTTGAGIGLIGRSRGKATINNGICFLNIVNAKKEVGVVAGHCPTGKLTVNNFFGDLTIDAITQVAYFNNFIGSYSQNAAYSASNVVFIQEDYSSLSDSITPDVKAISTGTMVDKPEEYNQRFFEEYAPFKDLDTSTVFSYDASISRPIVSINAEEDIKIKASYINSFIDQIQDKFTVNNRYYIIKASNLLEYVIPEERDQVETEKLNKAIEDYNEVMKGVNDIVDNL